jgi:HK97 gp10 family phage protein
MARNTFDVAAYNARLARISVGVRAAMKEALDRYSDQAVDLIKRNIPKRSRALEETVVKTQGRTELSVQISVGNAEHPYAPAVEFGHMDHGTHVPADPFFFPAVRVTKKKYRAGMVSSVRKAMKAECSS